MISGLAPASGDYVVCVLVTEYRRGIPLSAHRKDFIIHVDDRCDIPSAVLKPTYITCDGFGFAFANEAPASPLIHTYTWIFGATGARNDTSRQPTPTFVYPDTGVYHVKLIVNRGEQCSDSATTLMSIFPGFHPGFISNGICILNPVLFVDTSKTRYGFINSRLWSFGEPGAAGDTSLFPDPTFKYSATGTKTVQLIVTSNKGCSDTITKPLEIIDKPPIVLPFRDTLICNIDTLQLHARGTGEFTWTPTDRATRTHTADPFVNPQTTTIYTVNLDEAGCVNQDSLRVRVVDHVTLQVDDSTICTGDTALLSPQGDGLYYTWTPAAYLDNPSIRNPLAHPPTDTRYTVLATIGKCFAEKNLLIRTVPYPTSLAKADTFICYNDTAYLHGAGNGVRYNWIPVTGLSNPNILNPLAFPATTTEYTLYVYDTLGCPKPGFSRLTVTVNPEIYAFAGNDTSVVVGQPLQLQGSGAPAFFWTPAQGLDHDDISNPVARITADQTFVMKAYNEAGCYAYDSLHVRVFKTAPDIFVPNAFTPERTTNNLFRPVLVGISKLVYFRVYNRLGREVYQTTRPGDGWDGTCNGVPQAIGGYVWMALGDDYTGRAVSRKGVMVLIR